MAYNVFHKLKDNISAIEIALNWKEHDKLSSSEIETLEKYAGFGGIKAILFPYGSREEWENLNASKEDLQLYEPIMELHEFLEKHFQRDYRSVIDSLRNSVLTAYYTPAIIPQTLYQVLKKHNIRPSRLYEPSCGAGVFVNEAIKAFSLEKITSVEKDKITARILQALLSNQNVPHIEYALPFEEAAAKDNEKNDIIVSNIPFGNFAVYDPSVKENEFTNRIHNYFFAKGLDKIADGGFLAYLTTDAFLNSPSNKQVREYVFQKSDFISLAVMPDNLMKETGNTEAPSHLIIIQKNDSKRSLSQDEISLIETSEQTNEFGLYCVNQYIKDHPEIIVGDEIKAGKNQYGDAHEMIWQNGSIENIAPKLFEILDNGFGLRTDIEKFHLLQAAIPEKNASNEGIKLTFLKIPETKVELSSAQLGLFDQAPAQNVNRALSYLKDTDDKIIKRHTARLISTIKTQDHPDHESIVLLTAISKLNNKYLYKLHSNVSEVRVPSKWMGASLLSDQLELVSQSLKRFAHEFLYEGDKSIEDLFALKVNSLFKFSGLQSFYKNGVLVDRGTKIGLLNNVDKENNQATFNPIEIADKDLPFFQQYILTRDKYLELSEREFHDQIEYPGLRNQLNALYNRFTSSFGNLNDPGNSRKIQIDEAFGFIVLSSLERRTENGYTKADILLTPQLQNNTTYKAENATDALAISLNEFGKVNISYIAGLINADVETVTKELEDHILLNPGTREWETKDQYLSGDVLSKLEIAEERYSNDERNEQYKRSIDALRKVQPEKIPFELLDFNLGERWIPIALYDKFSTEFFEVNTKVHYFKSLDTFKVIPEKANTKITDEYAINPKSGDKMHGNIILEHALENTTPYFSYTITDANGDEIKVPDVEANQLALQKIESIRQHFSEWMHEQPEDAKIEITSLYNRLFNCYVLREYNGDHLTFPGLRLDNLDIKGLYDSQKSSAWRILQCNGALIDHEVGLGKTLLMIVALHELKRLGIVQKPAILAMKANVSQIVETYRRAYPHKKLLAPTENDFIPENRRRLFFEIMNNQWDCIIMTHEQFGKIPQSYEIQREICHDELNNVEKDLNAVRELGGNVSRRMLKGLEIRKENLTAFLKETLHNIATKKDRDVDFKKMGIDHLFVDEFQKFKNLTFTTRHKRVAGLGSPQGSNRALNMLFAVRELQNQRNSDLAVTFLSGTPISNSLTEMYLIFKYLRPNELKRQHIENFDSWAAVFARKTVDFEFSVTNQIIAKERFRHFIKVPELALFYNGITDYKTSAHIKLDKPSLDEELVNIPPTSQQKEFIKRLIEFARTGDGELIGRGKLSKEEEKAKMLIATNYAKKLAVDIRLIDPSYPDDPGNKVSICARKVAQIYNDSREYRGTQIIFCDIGTPKSDEFNVYDALRQKLIEEYGVAPHHVTYIHDWSEKTRPELFRKMNRGEIRILIGSTDKAGTGVNVQRKVVAMHHLDIPWRPSDLDQRNGRAARQGNQLAKEHYNNKVKNYIYAVELTLDNYKFNLLKHKQGFISQIKTSSLQARTIDEGGMDEQTGMNFSEYIAILSGDTTLLEKSRLEKKVAALELLRTAHYKEMIRTKSKIERLTSEKDSSAKIIEALKVDQAIYKTNLLYEKDGSKSNPISITGQPIADAESIGKYLINLHQSFLPLVGVEAQQKIGELYGFDLYISATKNWSTSDGDGFSKNYFAINPHGQIKYSYNQGKPNIDNPKIAARFFLNAIDRIDSLIEHHSKEYQESVKDILTLQKVIARPFEKEKDLEQMKSEISQLEKKISLNIQHNIQSGSQQSLQLEVVASHENGAPKLLTHDPEKVVSSKLKELLPQQNGEFQSQKIKV